jgi:hypothetical protein
MGKYIILDENNRVSNVILSNSEPTEGNFKNASSYTSYNIDMKYIPEDDIFVSPISVNTFSDTNEYEEINTVPHLVFSGSGSLGITCSFSREITEIPSSSLSLDNNSLDIVDYTFNTSKNAAYFTLITGSGYSTIGGDVETTLNFSKQHTDSYGLKWDIRPQYFLVK